MYGRKQEPSVVARQIADGAFMVAAFVAAHVFWARISNLFSNACLFDPDFNGERWVLFVLMPFGSIILESQGFYRSVPGEKLVAAALKAARAGFIIGVLIEISSVIFRERMPDWKVLVTAYLLSGGLILARDRMMSVCLSRRESAQ